MNVTRSAEIFTLDVDDRSILTFEAADISEASGISLDQNLRLDLSALTAGGVPICTENATLTARPARQEEIATFKRASKLAPASDQPTMVFLIQLDGLVIAASIPLASRHGRASHN